MSRVDRSDANKKMLKEADDIQNKTAEALARINKQTLETEDVAGKTIEELRKQAAQMDEISAEIDSVNTKLDQASSLQTKFDSWAGNWLGGKKRAALKEASAEISSASSTKTNTQPKEIYEQEKYDILSRTWKPNGQVLCTDPTISANDPFDPSTQTADSSWSVDYSLSNIDAEGWTYAYDYNTLNKNPSAGESQPKWNLYVRRRKWKYIEKKLAGGNAIAEIAGRQNDRRAKGTGPANQAEKVGYVPRNRNAGMTATGLTVTGSSRKDDQDLDEESAAGLARLQAKDAEIDRGLDEISRTIDRLGNMATTIKDAAKDSTAKIDLIDKKLQNANEKQTVVNARLRGQLK